MNFSVLLSIYSKEKRDFFNQAFLSIWEQQTLKPSQIVLVKDGPLTPELDVEINYWKCKLGDVLTLVSLPENVGLGAALNAGLKACKYDLVARMDTDDVALSRRFERQVSFMENYPNIAASSAQLEEWDEQLLKCTGKRQLPLDSTSIAVFAKRRSPLSHPLVIFRRSLILSLGGYPSLRNAQDYALWSLLLANGYQLANLSDTLLIMRTGDDLYNRRSWLFFKQEIFLLRYQRDIGFLGFFDYWFNFFIKVGLRLSPAFIKRFAYRYAR